jgi:hypothetical protein
MIRLIRPGSKTRTAVEPGGLFKLEGVALHSRLRLIALENGTDIGEFSTAEEAKAHAEILLAQNRSATYWVCEDGNVIRWVYDREEQRRIDGVKDWRNALRTAPILALITAGAIALRGVSVFSKPGLVLVSISAFGYLLMRTTQNAIEGLVAWLMFFVLGLVGLHEWVKLITSLLR